MIFEKVWFVTFSYRHDSWFPHHLLKPHTLSKETFIPLFLFSNFWYKVYFQKFSHDPFFYQRLQDFSISDLFSLSVEAKAIIATERNNGDITNILQQHPFVSLPQKNNKNKSKDKIHTATKAQVCNIQKYAAFPYTSCTSPAQLSKFVQSLINKTQKYQLHYTVSKNFYSVKCLVTQSYKLNHISKNTGNRAHLTKTYSIRPNKI